jgi:hypothetical protein
MLCDDFVRPSQAGGFGAKGSLGAKIGAESPV